MVRCPACIGVVLLNRQAGLMIQQAIQHIRRFAGSRRDHPAREGIISIRDMGVEGDARFVAAACVDVADRSEEHTSELQSLMRISYAVFCLKKKKTQLSRTLHTPKLLRMQIQNTKHHTRTQRKS